MACGQRFYGGVRVIQTVGVAAVGIESEAAVGAGHRTANRAAGDGFGVAGVIRGGGGIVCAHYVDC